MQIFFTLALTFILLAPSLSHPALNTLAGRITRRTSKVIFDHPDKPRMF